MLVTENDAVMKKWCPMVRLRLEQKQFAFNRVNPGPKARVKNVLYRMFFPRTHHQMRGHFYRCQGSGCMMWRWEANTPRVPELRRGYCGLAGTPLTFT